MLRSIRAAMATNRQAKAKAIARRLLLEPLEQRQLLSISPAPGLTPTDLAPSAIYGPVQASATRLAAIQLQPEGEGETPAPISAARQLLFAGIAGATASPTNSGLLTIIDTAADSPTDTIVPWKAPLSTGGISGLAFDLSGRLFAAVDQGACTPSELVELNPNDGAVLRRLPIMAESAQINIGDLAVEPATGKLFGTRSIYDDAILDNANHAGELFVIDVDSGEATLIGDTGAGAGEGLAFASDGSLYLAGTAGGKPVLYKIDPETAEPHQRDASTGRAVPFIVLNDPTGRLKEVEGLAGHPDNGTLIATTSKNRFAGNQIVDDTFAIDLATGSVTAQSLASPARGIFGDLAFQPSPRVLDIVYQENFENGNGGFVTDNTGGTLPGLWHYSLGRRFDSLPSHTPVNSFYYGAFETAFGEGHYVLPLDHEGTLTSPAIQLPTSSVLSFNYLLETRPELNVDFVDVSVITADGNITQIISRADGTLPQTGSQRWRTATADLSAFACQPIQLQFSFDTGAAPQIDPEGWYLDDVMIGSTGSFCDFGDAPDDAENSDDYPTLSASNGARHAVVTGFQLGSAIDGEPDGQPSPMADGDDNNPAAGPDDEDGVTFPSGVGQNESLLYVGQTVAVEVELLSDSTRSAFLDAWIDFNQDGDWLDDGEQIASSQPLTSGTNTISLRVPDDATLGDTFARFRLSSSGGLSPAGPASDGEVEDYKITIAPATNFAIDKRDDGTDAVAGDHYTYTIDVINNGPSDSSGATVIDTLPSGWQLVSSTNASCSGDAASPQMVTCEVGALAAGESTTFTITTALPADAIPATVTNSVVVMPNEHDPDLADNTATEDTRVVIMTDFAIDKRDDGSDAVAGEHYAYTIEVTNNGPSDSSGAEVIDTLPAGWTFVSSDNVSCTGDGGSPEMVVCDVTALPAGQRISFTLTTAVPANALPGVATNTATVMPNEGDSRTATEETNVTLRTDFAIDKRDDGLVAVPGQDYAYIIEVTNAGPSDSTGAEVIDTLPVGWTFVSASGAACHAEPSDPEMVRCDLGPLPVDGMHSFTIVAHVPPDATPGTVTNQVTVTPNEDDPNLNDNTATEDTDVMNTAAISGQVFNDVDGNATSDSFETGINFVTVQLFVDANGNGLLDDGVEPLQQITMGDGSYEFTRLVPGAYLVDVVDSTLPPDSVLTTGSAPIAIVLEPGTDAAVDFGYQNVIQFVTPLGYFSTKDGTSPGFREGIPTDLVVPFVRPADDFLVNVLVRDSTDSYQLPTLLAALTPWQSFTIKNTTGAPLEISELNKTIAEPGSQQFVKIFSQQQLDDLAAKEVAGTPITVHDLRGITNEDLSSNPIPLGTEASNDEVTFFAFYQPVELDTTGPSDVIMRQLPDWSDDPSTPENETLVDGKAHTFTRQDRLEVVTRFADGSPAAGQTAPAFQFQLVGGSTYDSDILDYNGRTQRADFDLLNTVILGRQPSTNQTKPDWDPTTDINIRLPDGADGTFGNVWPDNLFREVALGDYGALNLEFARSSRAPFLDLDASQSVGAIGVDYQTSTDGSAVFVASSNAMFANAGNQDLDKLVVAIVNPTGSDQILIDEAELPPTIVATGNGTSELTLRTIEVVGELEPTVQDYGELLAKIAYSSGNAPAVPGTRVITFQATGSARDFAFTSGNVTLDQTAGNIAISRVTVRPNSI